MSNHDLEQFDSDALSFFANFINEGINQIAGLNPHYFTDLDLENLQALRIMIFNAKNVVAKRELTDKN